MNSRSHKRLIPEIATMFDSGANFFRQFGEVFENVGWFFYRYKSTSENINHKPNKINKNDVIYASYRFMGLVRGCGIEAVKHRFREMVLEIRPDIKDDELTKKKYMALRIARNNLLDLETQND